MQPSGAYYLLMTRCLLLLMVALTISGGAASGATGSGLRGVVTRGPIMPVCMVDQPCDEPAANVRLVFVQSGAVVARARTSEPAGTASPWHPGATQCGCRASLHWAGS